MKKIMKNKKVTYTIIGIVAILLVVMGVTYAYWLVTKTQAERNIVTAKCLDLNLTGEANDISLTNQFPISDEEGLKLTPYTFTVSNTCDNDVSYRVALEMLGTESEMVTSSGIKVDLSGNMGVLNNFNEIDTTIEGAYESRAIGYGTLASNGSEGDSDSYELRIWIDKDASISEMKKTFRSKITVTTGQGMDSVYQEGTLAYDIVARYGGPNAVTNPSGEYELKDSGVAEFVSSHITFADNIKIDQKTGLIYQQDSGEKLSDCYEQETNSYGKIVYINNCSKNIFYSGSDSFIYRHGGYYDGATALASVIYPLQPFDTTTDTGLYKLQDDYGTSYYYRGDVENNYLKLKNQVYHETTIPAQEVEEAYKATILAFADDVPESAQSIISSWIFTSEDECLTMGIEMGNMWTTCEKQNQEITELYFPTDNVLSISIGYITEEECTIAGASMGFTTCEKRELRKERIPSTTKSWYEDVYTNWRIVRVNGDGTIRLIYEGDNLYENGVSHSTTVFSLNQWYEDNIKGEIIENYVSDGLFCIDKEKHSNHNEPFFRYRGNVRIKNNSPSLNCPGENNQYTVSNNKLTYPIGELTADEAALAGVLGVTSTSNYLISSIFATSTPHSDNPYPNAYGYSGIYNYEVTESGTLSEKAGNNLQHRPVINLKADVPFTGSGTITDPYVIGE